MWTVILDTIKELKYRQVRLISLFVSEIVMYVWKAWKPAMVSLPGRNFIQVLTRSLTSSFKENQSFFRAAGRTSSAWARQIQTRGRGIATISCLDRCYCIIWKLWRFISKFRRFHEYTLLTFVISRKFDVSHNFDVLSLHFELPTRDRKLFSGNFDVSISKFGPLFSIDVLSMHFGDASQNVKSLPRNKGPSRKLLST